MVLVVESRANLQQIEKGLNVFAGKNQFVLMEVAKNLRVYCSGETCKGLKFSRISCPISISNEFNSTLLAHDLSVNSVIKVKFESNGCGSVFYFGKIEEIFVRNGITQIKIWFEDDETLLYILNELLSEFFFAVIPSILRKSVKAMPLLMLSTFLGRTTNLPKK